MTDHHSQNSRSGGRRPTARQQRYLRELAMQRGVTFTIPRTAGEASRLIDSLKRRAAEPAADRRRELRALRDDMASDRGDGARVREDLEVTGYGSSATWNREALR